MRVLTWNVNARTTRRAEQAEFVVSRTPDVVSLQEVPDSTLEAWRSDLERGGLGHSLASVCDEPRRRGRGLLLAARHPLRLVERHAHVLLSATLADPRREVDVHAVQIPNGSDNGVGKVEGFEAVHSRLAGAPQRLRILLGDLNSPRAEHADGTVITWGQNPSGSLIARRGSRWDAAERSVLTGLREHGMVDVFRDLHGYAVEEKSWLWRNRGAVGGYRLDHIIASAELTPVAVRYLHEPRDAGLSDHSALEALFR